MDAGWVAVVSGSIAMVSSFGTVAFTNVFAQKRHRSELSNAQDLESRKLLYERRVGMYSEVSETLKVIDDTFSELRWEYVNHSDRMNVELYDDLQRRIDSIWDEFIPKLRHLARTGLVIAPVELCDTIGAVANEAVIVLLRLRGAHRDKRWSRLDFVKMSNALIRNHRRCTDLMATGLGNARSGEISPLIEDASEFSDFDLENADTIALVEVYEII
ncbi:hypothetical protein [Amycolatopsis sp. Poz14]|uniref:hypothetical protein n=1 Tax=Amycolatopsis sp. Poz14 TaxID=1447705 RepID=UPI001EE97602|nr:hypothetical protein [Amycolatopsis sp. Poz14]MCG3754678.1 hypothetical protein [Amycolatopsis sp. Poz14]